jgi:hypothetical protein
VELGLSSVVVGVIPERSGIGDPAQSEATMIKSLVSLAIFALLGTSVIALPMFAPEVKANEALAQGNADRLAIHPVIRDCSDQVWPNFDRSCLREAGSGIRVREARLVTALR